MRIRIQHKQTVYQIQRAYTEGNFQFDVFGHNQEWQDFIWCQAQQETKSPQTFHSRRVTVTQMCYTAGATSLITSK